MNGSAGAEYIHGTHAEEQRRLARLNRMTNAAFIEFLALAGGERVLEVGSGLGILAGEVAEHLPKGRVVGVEYASAQLHVAQTNAMPRLAFVQGDAHALPFADESFDVAYCRYLLEHVARPAEVLREARRVLAEGGRVLLQENNILAVDFYPDCPQFMHVWRHFAELQSRLGGDALIGKKLHSLLYEAGFRKIELSTQPEVHWSGLESFRPWVENLIDNVRGGASKLVRENLVTVVEVEAACGELAEFMERKDATALFYWNRARAEK